MWKYISSSQCKEFLLSLKLFDYSDENLYIKTLYSISNNTENNYKIHKIKKRNGKLRMIYEPSVLLKEIQRNILVNILNNKAISKYAKAYHKGISLRDNAICHVNKKIILKLDIENFFDSINFLDIYHSCFSIEYFPKQVGMLLTYLCTYQEKLPQGSPCASYISNLVMKEFDEEVGKICLEKNIMYTRYSDDMTFSGDFNPKEIITIVRKKLYKLGLKLNDNKTVVVGKNHRQEVTGIVVNSKVQVNSSYRKKIRQEVYYIKKFGIKSHLEKLGLEISTIKYLNKLYGKILYVLQINPHDTEFLCYKQYIGILKSKM